MRGLTSQIIGARTTVVVTRHANLLAACTSRSSYCNEKQAASSDLNLYLESSGNALQPVYGDSCNGVAGVQHFLVEFVSSIFGSCCATHAAVAKRHANLLPVCTSKKFML